MDQNFTFFFSITTETNRTCTQSALHLSKIEFPLLNSASVTFSLLNSDGENCLAQTSANLVLYLVPETIAADIKLGQISLCGEKLHISHNSGKCPVLAEITSNFVKTDAGSTGLMENGQIRICFDVPRHYIVHRICLGENCFSPFSLKKSDEKHTESEENVDSLKCTKRLCVSIPKEAFAEKKNFFDRTQYKSNFTFKSVRRRDSPVVPVEIWADFVEVFEQKLVQKGDQKILGKYFDSDFINYEWAFFENVFCILMFFFTLFVIFKCFYTFK